MGLNESISKRKFIALSASKKKLERAYSSILTELLEALELREANSPKRSRWQVINPWLKSTKWKQKELFKESTKPGAGSLRKSKPLARITRGHRDSTLNNKIKMKRET